MEFGEWENEISVDEDEILGFDDRSIMSLLIVYLDWNFG